MKLPRSKRIEKIQKLILAAGKSIDSKKKLQKLAYICQVSGEDLSQDFIFHHYGVFSPSLASDLEKAVDLGVLKTVSLAGVAVKTSLNQPVEDTDVSSNGYTVVSELKNESTPMLEALTTVIYLSKLGYSGHELKSKFDNLKEHLSDKFEESLNLAKSYNFVQA